MTRALFFLLFLTIFSLAALWFVENDGSIIVEWMGYRVQTSVAFAILFIIITIVTCTLFLQVIIWIKNAPKRYKRVMKDKKLSRGLTALSQGFAAIAAGDIKQARALTSRASNNLDNMPLTKLLAAQTAQLEGNKELAKEHYTAMLGDKETEIIAIKGLLIEAKEEKDFAKALFLAEKAYKLRPNADWVILILFDLFRKLKKWNNAEDIAKKALKQKLISKEAANSSFALISFARYQDAGKPNNQTGTGYIKNAYKLKPDLVPIIIAYAQNLVQRDKVRKAVKLLEKHWFECPHPDIAALYMEIHNEDSQEERIEKSEKLLKLSNEHPEGHVIAASIAIEAGQFGKARHHLKIALGYGDTKAICLLMAELETIEKATHEVIYYWRERANAAHELSVWKCHSCGNLTNKWYVICNICSGFDSIGWQDSKSEKTVKKQENLLGIAVGGESQ